jgi:hypothetical protein
VPKRPLVFALGIVLTLAACSSSSKSSSPPVPTSSPTTAPAARWAKVDRGVAALGPQTSLLVASVAPDGTCQPIHEVSSTRVQPTASQFKLFVLGALAKQIAAGKITGNQTLTVQDAGKSVGNGAGSLQTLAPGTKVSVQDVATKMISISDNTAADMLIKLVGRDNVEAQVAEWSEHASANTPFLTTREMFLLHYSKGLGDRYLATPAGARAAFVASAVDPLPIGAIATAYSSNPRFVDRIEWFASPSDICRAFAGLHVMVHNPKLAPLASVLSRETGTIGLDRSQWPTVWFKGGSEPGVLTLGWLATNRDGRTFVVETMIANPKAVLSEHSITDLVALSRQAFGLLTPGP